MFTRYYSLFSGIYQVILDAWQDLQDDTSTTYIKTESKSKTDQVILDDWQDLQDDTSMTDIKTESKSKTAALSSKQEARRSVAAAQKALKKSVAQNEKTATTVARMQSLGAELMHANAEFDGELAEILEDILRARGELNGEKQFPNLMNISAYITSHTSSIKSRRKCRAMLVINSNSCESHMATARARSSPKRKSTF